MDSEYAADKVLDRLQKLITTSSGTKSSSFLRASNVINKEPAYNVLATLSWDDDGELTVK